MSHPPPPGAGIRLSSQLGQQIANFEQQPNLGGLGIVDSQPGSGPALGQGQGQGQYQSLVCPLLITARCELQSWAGILILMDRWEECTLPVHRTSHDNRAGRKIKDKNENESEKRDKQ